MPNYSQGTKLTIASNEEPPYLSIGTDVSAKYKGAFCEAKITDVNKHVKVRVLFEGGNGTYLINETDLKTGSTLETGTKIEAKHPEKKQQTYVQATITKILDHSRYTVVFDDGDQCVLRRNSLCLKSGKHFAESETLDQLPLTNPEHFGNPVKVGAIEQTSNSHVPQSTINKLNNIHQSSNDKPKKKSSSTATNSSSTTSEDTKSNINIGETNNNRKRQQQQEYNTHNIKKLKKERNTTNNTIPTSSGRRGSSKGKKRRESINNGTKHVTEVDDSSVSSGQDSADAIPTESDVGFDLIEVGVKLMVQYGKGKVQNVYEAKVNKIETNSLGKTRYFVHYTGWNNRYDEWITKNRILSIVSEKENGSKDGRFRQSENSHTIPPIATTATSSATTTTIVPTPSIKDKDREKEKERERDKEKDKDKDKDKDREKEKVKEKVIDKEKEVPPKTRLTRQAEVTINTPTSTTINPAIHTTCPSNNILTLPSTTSSSQLTVTPVSVISSIVTVAGSSTTTPAITTVVSSSKDKEREKREEKEKEKTKERDKEKERDREKATDQERDKGKEVSTKTRRARQTEVNNIVASNNVTNPQPAEPSTFCLLSVGLPSKTTTLPKEREKEKDKEKDKDKDREKEKVKEKVIDKEKEALPKTRRTRQAEVTIATPTNTTINPAIYTTCPPNDTLTLPSSTSSSHSIVTPVPVISSTATLAGSSTTTPSNTITSSSKDKEKEKEKREDKTKERDKEKDREKGTDQEKEEGKEVSTKSRRARQTEVNNIVTSNNVTDPQPAEPSAFCLLSVVLPNKTTTLPISRPTHKFDEGIDESDCDKKISIIQERIMSLRQAYSLLKTELNDLDRRRKRPRTERSNSEHINCSLVCRN